MGLTITSIWRLLVKDMEDTLDATCDQVGHRRAVTMLHTVLSIKFPFSATATHIEFAYMCHPRTQQAGAAEPPCPHHQYLELNLPSRLPPNPVSSM